MKKSELKQLIREIVSKVNEVGGDLSNSKYDPNSIFFTPDRKPITNATYEGSLKRVVSGLHAAGGERRHTVEDTIAFIFGKSVDQVKKDLESTQDEWSDQMGHYEAGQMGRNRYNG
jgi:hypothetical protein